MFVFQRRCWTELAERAKVGLAEGRGKGKISEERKELLLLLAVTAAPVSLFPGHTCGSFPKEWHCTTAAPSPIPSLRATSARPSITLCYTDKTQVIS